MEFGVRGWEEQLLERPFPPARQRKSPAGSVFKDRFTGLSGKAYGTERNRLQSAGLAYCFGFTWGGHTQPFLGLSLALCSGLTACSAWGPMRGVRDQHRVSHVSGKLPLPVLRSIAVCLSRTLSQSRPMASRPRR